MEPARDRHVSAAFRGEGRAEAGVRLSHRRQAEIRKSRASLAVGGDTPRASRAFASRWAALLAFVAAKRAGAGARQRADANIRTGQFHLRADARRRLARSGDLHSIQLSQCSARPAALSRSCRGCRHRRLGVDRLQGGRRAAGAGDVPHAQAGRGRLDRCLSRRRCGVSTRYESLRNLSSEAGRLSRPCASAFLWPDHRR